MGKWHEKKLEELEERPELNINLDLLRATLKKILNSKRLGYDDFHEFWLKYSHLSMTNWLCNWVNSSKKQAYLNGRLKGKNILIEKDPRKSVMFWPGQKCHSRWCTGRKWHILMAVMRGNRVGGNWLMKWDELKNSHGTLQSDAPEESDLCTAWQLFPLDDD